MPINFPSSPSIGQIYEYQSIRWRWNGSAWDKYEVFTFNGLTANVEGVGSWNGLTGAVTFSNYVATFGGKTGTVGAGITSNQILYWLNNDVTGSNNFTFDGTDVVTLATSGHFTGRLLGPTLVPIKNTSGVTITKGTPVYATGSVGASGQVEVAACDASVSAKMPAIGLADSTLGINGEGHAVVFGNLLQVDTSAYTINGTVYVAPGGGLTGIKPTGATQLIQNVGRVTRVHPNTGDILVSAIGRANDVPNVVQVVSYLQMPDGMTATGLVRSFNGLTGAVTGASLGANTFTDLNTFNAGISSAGGTFSSLTRFTAGLSAAGITTGTITNILNIYGKDNGNTAGLTLWADPGLGNPVYISLSKGVSDSGTVNIQAGTLNLSSATSLFGEEPSIVMDVYDGDSGVYRKAEIVGGGSITANRTYSFPDASGDFIVTGNVASNAVTSFNGNIGAVQGVSSAVAGTGISVSGATGAVTITNIGVQSFNGLTGAVTGVTGVNGLTGALTVSGGTGMSVLSGGSGITLVNTGVLSVNGSTGAVANVARTNVNNNFSAAQTIGATGIILTLTDNDLLNQIYFNPTITNIASYADLTNTTQTLQFDNISGNATTATLPAFDTVLAGLSGTQTFGGTKTFNALTNFNGGISSAGGTFSALTRFTAGISAAGITTSSLRVTGNSTFDGDISASTIREISASTLYIENTNDYVYIGDGLGEANSTYFAISDVSTAAELLTGTFDITAYTSCTSPDQTAGAALTVNTDSSLFGAGNCFQVTNTFNSSTPVQISAAGAMTLTGRLTASGGITTAGINATGITLNGTIISSGLGTFNSGITAAGGTFTNDIYIINTSNNTSVKVTTNARSWFL